MKENELRIGNLVQLSQEGFDEVRDMINEDSSQYPKCITNYATVSSISSCPEVELYKDGCDLYHWNFDSISGIPLTEQWLIRLGFEKIGINYNMSIFNVYRRKSDNKLLYRNNVYAVELKHVHQLQNLYFALTGEELELTKE